MHNFSKITIARIYLYTSIFCSHTLWICYIEMLIVIFTLVKWFRVFYSIKVHFFCQNKRCVSFCRDKQKYLFWNLYWNHYCTTSFNEPWNEVQRRFKSCSRRVGDSRWWGSLTMVLAGNKAKCLSSVNHTTKSNHHYHHHRHHHHQVSTEVLIICPLKFKKPYYPCFLWGLGDPPPLSLDLDYYKCKQNKTLHEYRTALYKKK